MFGSLRGHEIETRGFAIGHSLTLALPVRTGNNHMLGKGLMAPAFHRDTAVVQNRPGFGEGSIPYGALLALPPNVNIDALGLSEPGRRLAQAMRDYGMYVTDMIPNGGQPAIQADQHITQATRAQLVQRDIPKIYPHIRMVLNSEWRSGQTAVGGGQPLAPNCAVGASASQRNVSTQSSPPAASTPQSGQAGSTADSQNQQASGGSTSSTGGMLRWAAVRNAQNYYLEIRAGSARGERVFGGMVRPDAGGCPNGQGTCSFAVPSLAAGQQYVWNVRAVVGGRAQSPTPWQNVASSGESDSTSTAQSSAPSAPQTDTSSSGTGSNQTTSAGGMLSWAAVRNARSYYFIIREGSNRGPVVFDRMVRPQEAGCGGGQVTCSLAMPPLPAGRQYVWAARASVNGSFEAPNWQQLASSSGASSTSTAQSSAPSVPQTGSVTPSTSAGPLRWAAVPRANNYYLEIRAGSGRGERVFGRMVRPNAGGCPNGQGTCSFAVPSLAAGQQHVWNVRAVIGGQIQSPTAWQPVP